jgi:hypothetical protein
MYIFEYLHKRPKLINIIQFLVSYVLDAPLFLWYFIFHNIPISNIIKFAKLPEEFFARIEDILYHADIELKKKL